MHRKATSKSAGNVRRRFTNVAVCWNAIRSTFGATPEGISMEPAWRNMASRNKSDVDRKPNGVIALYSAITPQFPRDKQSASPGAGTIAALDHALLVDLGD